MSKKDRIAALELRVEKLEHELEYVRAASLVRDFTQPIMNYDPRFLDSYQGGGFTTRYTAIQAIGLILEHLGLVINKTKPIQSELELLKDL